MSKAVLLDTNVLSELMRHQPDAKVPAWFGANADAGYYTSAVTVSEILLGIFLLPSGKRQTRLDDAAIKMFSEDFSGRCLPFEELAAKNCAEIVAARTRSGRSISTEGAQITAIALTNRLRLATRNVGKHHDSKLLTVQ